MRTKKDNTIKTRMISARIPDFLDSVLERVCVEDKSKKKQDLIGEAINEYLLKRYPEYYKEYKEKEQ